MADGLAAGLVSNWLNTLRSGGAAYTNTATYAQLHTGLPGAAGTANKSANLTRVIFTFAASAAGSALALTGTNPAWTNGGTSETITDISVWTTLTDGTGVFLFSITLTISKAWASGDTLTLNTLTVSLTPVAS